MTNKVFGAAPHEKPKEGLTAEIIAKALAMAAPRRFEMVPRDATCRGCRWWSQVNLDPDRTRGWCTANPPAFGETITEGTRPACRHWEAK